jgi:hypothetical protein
MLLSLILDLVYRTGFADEIIAEMSTKVPLEAFFAKNG